MRPVSVLVIRTDDGFSLRLRDAGFEVLNFDTIRTEPIGNRADMISAIEELDRYDGLFFTSPVSAGVFIDELKRAGNEVKGTIYVLGERTRRIFENAGIAVEFRPDANTAGDLIASFPDAEFDGKRFLFVCGDRSLRAIPTLLGERAQVDEIVVYRTVDVTPDPAFAAVIVERLRKGTVDWTCFFSPSGVESFIRIFGINDPGSTKMAAIGGTTGQKVIEAGLKVDFTAQRSNADDFAIGLIEYIKNFE